MAMGRPTKYTPELGDLICDGVSRKTPLARLCDENEELPAVRTVYGWLRTHDDFLQNYTRAKEDQADFLAEEVIEIADNPLLDAADKRVMVDARKWYTAKCRPKKYSEKHQIDHTSSDNSMTPTRIERVIIDPADQDA